MLEARQQLSAALTDGDKDFYTNKCKTLDLQIDALVYELYGRTDEETKIVKGTNKWKFAPLESQRDSIHQPRVARHELPWVMRQKHFQPPTGLHHGAAKP